MDEALIPALDIVGAKYEKGTLFLPQLLQAATAAQGAFEEIKTAIAQKGEGSASKGRIVIATVKGDVHDIGKNIVRVILENYGFEVIDLGRDVPVETVVNTVREKDVHLVGLSALMTTTLKSMEETIRALHDAKLDCKIMVGGAVLTPEYAKKDRCRLVRQGCQAECRYCQGVLWCISQAIKRKRPSPHCFAIPGEGRFFAYFLIQLSTALTRALPRRPRSLGRSIRAMAQTPAKLNRMMAAVRRPVHRP